MVREPYIECRKCGHRLILWEPTLSFSHCGTDFWTKYGERRWKPTICMSCRSKVGANAQKAQALQSTRQRGTIKD